MDRVLRFARIQLSGVQAKQARNVLMLVVIAIALRLAALGAAWGRSSPGDPATYLALAENMLAGHGYGVYDPIYGAMAQKALYPPLYPLLLAAVGFFVPLSQPTVFAINVGIDLAAAWVIARLATELGFKPRLAVAIYLLWPSNVMFAPIPNKEGLASLLTVTAAWFAIRKSAVPFGVASGLLALAQPALATLPAIFAILLSAPIVISAGAAALVLLPWWIRNYMVFGTFVPLTTASGFSFWVGTFSKTGWWLPPPSRIQVSDELRFSGVAAADAWAWISAHPVEYAKHCLEKLARGLVNGWWPVDRLVRMAPASKPAFLVLAPFSIGLTSLLTTIGIFGGVVVRGVIGRLLLACAIQIVVFGVWFEFSERHTYFAIPFLAVAAGAGIQKVWQDTKADRTPATQAA